MSSIRVRNHRRFKRPKVKTPGRKFIWPVHPKYLLCFAFLGALYWGYQTYGTPHLRFQYSYTGNYTRFYHACDYVGQYSQRYYPRNGRCPLFKFFRSRRGY